MTEIIYAPRPAYAHMPREVWPPRLGLVHATRGHTSLELQDQATVNWFTGGAGDRGGWSPTADLLVSADEDRVWVFEESIAALRHWRSSFSAGYGSLGMAREWAADEQSISMEIAQSHLLEPYDDATIVRAAWLWRRVMDELGFRLPPLRVPSWSQLRVYTVPVGFIGHEDTANGVRGGKTDPGDKFPWPRFLALVQEEDDMTLKIPSSTETIDIALAMGHYQELVNDSKVPDGYQAFVASNPPPGKKRYVLDVPAN